VHSLPTARRRPLAGRVRKAVFPVAGLDTQLLPATKAAPREMLTVVDKPLIHYAVAEAIAAGINEMIFVTNRNKRAIEDHFDVALELESALSADELAGLQRLFPPHVQYIYVRQPEYTGLASTLRCVRPLVEGEPFALLLPDQLIDIRPGAIAQLIECFNVMQQPVIGVQPARAGEQAPDTLRTGNSFRERTHHVVRFARGQEPGVGELIAAGRYILTPSVLARLDAAPPPGAAETGLHDALDALLTDEPVVAYDIEGVRYDCRSKIGLLTATVHLALEHPELAAAFRDVLRDVQHSGAGAAAGVASNSP
jgi:UTP--glucose-1-phosphate uridylyltransferase